MKARDLVERLKQNLGVESKVEGKTVDRGRMYIAAGTGVKGDG